ncbi:hypothetical protein GOBAR_AA24316 [Gossypium barbadense]|uniref:Uncharacterized protein n=1 Tax=Gossypium barbadense TaxID=3634 RepID=A0A2P5WZ73_GOSBA|nr:hypothetical protein GOBAR_AA24316 [Gossypium barbadense]
MQLVEDDDVETMIALYCSLGNVEPIELFAELADVEPGEDFTDLVLDKVLDDTNDKGIDDDENINNPSLGNPTQGIVIWNDHSAYILSVDPNVAYASEFQEYPNIIPSHMLVPDPKSEELVVGYELQQHQFRQRIARLQDETNSDKGDGGQYTKSEVDVCKNIFPAVGNFLGDKARWASSGYPDQVLGPRVSNGCLR